MAYARMLDYRPRLDARPFKIAMAYRKGNAVQQDGQVYVCLKDHAGEDGLRPGTEPGNACWQLAVPRIVFQATEQGPQ